MYKIGFETLRKRDYEAIDSYSVSSEAGQSVLSGDIIYQVFVPSKRGPAFVLIYILHCIDCLMVQN